MTEAEELMRQEAVEVMHVGQDRFEYRVIDGAVLREKAKSIWIGILAESRMPLDLSDLTTDAVRDRANQILKNSNGEVICTFVDGSFLRIAPEACNTGIMEGFLDFCRTDFRCAVAATMSLEEQYKPEPGKPYVTIEQAKKRVWGDLEPNEVHD